MDVSDVKAVYWKGMSPPMLPFTLSSKREANVLHCAGNVPVKRRESETPSLWRLVSAPHCEGKVPDRSRL